MGAGIGAGIRVGKQAGGIAHKPGLGVDRIGAALGHRQPISVGAQDGLDGAVIRTAVGHGPVTGRLQSAVPISLGQADDALCGAQALHNLVAEQPVDDLLAVGPDLAGLLVQPLAVTGKEPLRLGWQVVGGGHALALALAARVGGHQHMTLIQGHTTVVGA